MSKIEDVWPVALRQELFSEYVFNDSRHVREGPLGMTYSRLGAGTVARSYSARTPR